MAKSSPISGGPSSAQERKWRAESDVRTLIQAQEIQKDRTRLALAQKAAAEQAKEAARVAHSMAGKKGKK